MNLSIVITLFNVEAYIKTLSDSLNANQLTDDIEIIIVNDGSSDNSFQLKYMLQHKNVIYLETENKGVHNARNLGLSRAQGKWITFIDGDDYLSDDYFKSIDYNVTCDVINSKMNLYIEADNKVLNHPLNYKFTKHTEVNINDEYQFLNLSVANLLLCRDLIINNNLSFKSTVISFEDASFYIDYLNCCQGNILVNPGSIYYYRKRMSNDSTIDRNYNNHIKYLDLIERVYLSKLNDNSSLFVQAMILYDLWNNMLSYTNFNHDLGDKRAVLIKEVINLISQEVIDWMELYLDKTYIKYVRSIKTGAPLLEVFNIKRGCYQVMTTVKLESNDNYQVDKETVIYNEFIKLYQYHLSTDNKLLVINNKKYFIKSLKNNLLTR